MLRCTGPLLVVVLRALQQAVWALPGALVPARDRFARRQALARAGAGVAAGVVPPVSPVASATGAGVGGLAAGPAVAVVRDPSPDGGHHSAPSPAGSAVLLPAPVSQSQGLFGSFFICLCVCVCVCVFLCSLFRTRVPLLFYVCLPLTVSVVVSVSEFVCELCECLCVCFWVSYLLRIRTHGRGPVFPVPFTPSRRCGAAGE